MQNVSGMLTPNSAWGCYNKLNSTTNQPSPVPIDISYANNTVTMNYTQPWAPASSLGCLGITYNASLLLGQSTNWTLSSFSNQTLQLVGAYNILCPGFGGGKRNTYLRYFCDPSQVTDTITYANETSKCVYNITISAARFCQGDFVCSPPPPIFNQSSIG